MPRKVISYFDRIVGLFILLNILALAILVFIQVLMRYVFRPPLMGIEELCYFPSTWLYLFAAVYASSEKSHLYAGVLEIVDYTLLYKGAELPLAKAIEEEF